MNKLCKFMAMAAMATMTVGLSACDDDDDAGIVGLPQPSEVFPAGTPKSVDGATITTNAQGLVSAVSDDEQRTTFDYTPGVMTYSIEDASRAGELISFAYDVVMTLEDIENPSSPTVKYKMYCKLNGSGYVSDVVQVDQRYGDVDTWKFAYNGAGQMNYMLRSEGGNEATSITYVDGDITKVEITEDAESRESNSGPTIYTISYTSDTQATKIENKGGIMLFDATFGIDLDEMDVAYFAGMLGKATRNLPVKNVCTDSEVITETYTWTLNSAGLPTKMELSSPYDNRTFSFAW